MPMADLIVGPNLRVPASAMRWSAARSSGPGGQKVNTSSTKVELRVQVRAIQGLDEAGFMRLRALAGHRWLASGELRVVSESARTQADNLRACIDRLTELLAKSAVRPKRRRATRPTRGSKRRRLDAKKARGEKKRLRGKVDQSS